eukprot:364813-Chlamydomonas_euryale.AAC.8
MSALPPRAAPGGGSMHAAAVRRKRRRRAGRPCRRISNPSAAAPAPVAARTSRAHGRASWPLCGVRRRRCKSEKRKQGTPCRSHSAHSHRRQGSAPRRRARERRRRSDPRVRPRGPSVGATLTPSFRTAAVC